MSAKNFTVLTFCMVVAIALSALVFVLLGGTWKGGTDGVPWVLFGIAGLVLGSYLVYQRKWSLAKMGARQLVAVERDLTLDQALEIFQKYSFLLLISACLFLAAAIAALFVY